MFEKYIDFSAFKNIIKLYIVFLCCMFLIKTFIIKPQKEILLSGGLKLQAYLKLEDFTSKPSLVCALDFDTSRNVSAKLAEVVLEIKLKIIMNNYYYLYKRVKNSNEFL